MGVVCRDGGRLGLMKRSRARPLLITDASVSQDEELRRRQRRYILMMALRIACLIVACVLVLAKVPLLGLWLPICLLGMVLLPWFAVILANDRPPKDKHRMKKYRENTAQANSLPSQATGKVIDAE
jgi:Flp pilus assembly protein TadB